MPPRHMLVLDFQYPQDGKRLHIRACKFINSMVEMSARQHTDSVCAFVIFTMICKYDNGSINSQHDS